MEPVGKPITCQSRLWLKCKSEGSFLRWIYNISDLKSQPSSCLAKTLAALYTTPIIFLAHSLGGFYYLSSSLRYFLKLLQVRALVCTFNTWTKPYSHVHSVLSLPHLPAERLIERRNRPVFSTLCKSRSREKADSLQVSFSTFIYDTKLIKFSSAACI